MLEIRKKIGKKTKGEAHLRDDSHLKVELLD
jgi:hypothetical protein